MSEEMKKTEMPNSYIKIGETIVNLDPKTQEEYTKMLSAQISLLAAVVCNTTKPIEKQKERAQRIVEISATINGQVMKIAMDMMNDEYAKKEEA